MNEQEKKELQSKLAMMSLKSSSQESMNWPTKPKLRV